MLILLPLLLPQLPVVPLQGTELLDINSVAVAIDSNPTMRLSMETGALFTAELDGLGHELYFTDGTTAGTVLVGDLFQGPGASAPNGFRELPNGQVVFHAASQTVGRELHVFDPATRTASVLIDLTPASASTFFEQTTIAGQYYYFVQSNSSGPDFLWRTDGTAIGTTFVSSLGFSFGSSNAFFSAFDSVFYASGGQLLRLGLQAGAQPESILSIDQTIGGPFGPSVIAPVELGAKLIFRAKPIGGEEGWIAYDSATGSVARLVSGSGDWAATAAGRVFFTTRPPGVPGGTRELWSSAGTPETTFKLDASVVQGLGEPTAAEPGVTEVGLVFAARSGAGYRVWRSDGSPGGTVDIGGQLFLPVDPNKSYESPEHFQDWRGAVVFTEIEYDVSVFMGLNSYFNIDTRLWSIPKHATQAVQLPLQSASGLPARLGHGGTDNGLSNIGVTLATTPAGVVFPALESETGSELWSVGAAPPALLANLVPDPTGGSSPSTFARNGNWVYFRADDGLSGAEPWRTDGTVAGTTQIMDLLPGALGSNARFGFEPFGDRMLFKAGPGSASELWITDGTPSGTVSLYSSPFADPDPARPYSTARLGDLYYFVASDPAIADRNLWSTDGSLAGTQVAIPSGAGIDTGGAFQLHVDAGRLYMVVVQTIGPTGYQWMSTDGTVAGTREEALSGEYLRFVGSRGGDQFLLRKYFGSHQLVRYEPATMTVEILDSWGNQGSGLSAFNTLEGVLVDDTVFYTPWVFGVGHQVRAHSRQPGDPRVLLTDTDPNYSVLVDLTRVGDRVVFVQRDASGSGTGLFLWKSSGQVADTLPVLGPLPVSNLFFEGSDVGDDLLYLGPAGADRELFHLDLDTLASTQITQFANAPGTGFVLDELQQFGDRVLLSAAADLDDVELHVVSTSSTEVPWSTAFDGGCGTIGNVPRMIFAGSLLTGTPAELRVAGQTPGGTLFVFYDLGLGSFGTPGSCTVSLAAPKLFQTAAVDSAGETTVGFTTPTTAALTSIPLYLQGFSTQPGGPFLGLGALTNPIELLIGL